MRSLKSRYVLGHIELGYTLAIWVIVILFIMLHYFSDGDPLNMWLSWPWWAKAMSVVLPLFIIFIGGLFERSRQWPKVSYRDEDDSHICSEDT